MSDKPCSALPVREGEEALAALRARVDEIDEALQELFERRMAAVEAIAACKRAQGLGVRDRAREEEKLSSVLSRAAAGLEPYDEALFRQLMELSRRRQEELLGEQEQ